MFKISNKITRTMLSVLESLLIKSKRCWSLFLIKLQAWSRKAWNFIKKDSNTGGRRSGASNVNFEHISHLLLVFLLSTLNISRTASLHIPFHWCNNANANSSSWKNEDNQPCSLAISCHWSFSIPPENIRKRLVFWCFWGV